MDILPEKNQVGRIQALGKIGCFLGAALYTYLYLRLPWILREWLILFIFGSVLLSLRNCATWMTIYTLRKYGAMILVMIGMALPSIRGANRNLFPFIPWSMYGTSETDSEIVLYRIVGVDSNGKEHEINPDRLFWGVNRASRLLGVDFRKLMLAMEGKEVNNEQDPALRAKLESFLIAIGKRYNRRNPHQIQRMKVYRVTGSVESKALSATPVEWVGNIGIEYEEHQ